MNRIKRRLATKEWQLHLMIAPGVVFLILFSYLPLYGILIAFKEFLPSKGIWASPWVGLKYFDFMMKLPDVWRVTNNTIYIAGLKILLGFPVPIGIALMLNEVRRSFFKKGVQTIIYLPHFLSWVILAGLILDVFSLTGIVNSFLGWFGIEPFYYLGDNRSFPWIIIATDIWKNFGWGTVIYLAALTGIDPALYESSVIDGANRWKQTLHITIPGIVPIIILTAILSLGNVLNAGFEQIFNLYNPLVMDRGDILDTYVYRVAFQETNWSLSTMVGLIKSVVNSVLIIAGYWLAYRITKYRVF
ncbi:ABC transporter permease [Paenibacillus sacheonensis]|uniref:ABC transporter permease subunit n=1 Tax=Paenibacillus sacheonensis TaxID=742054 RepID=A0A7X5C281_9BACL|nr:ABC transporter permease subunit [Paenibacillus sacheonensis]MBM7565151.1 putative aldouronate transport system permease protein [Paenibacillus sacheonensis]NBC70069.1 ABC transporter permease subunit [Paenibacillus sacheonensis]